MTNVQITPEEVNSLLSKAKTWIAAQEGHASGGRLPPGLTEEHINALRALKIIRKPEVFESREPGLEGENWIGKLLEYHQKNPSDLTPTFTEFSVMSANQLRFRCSVIISEHQHRAFPREEDYPNGATEAPTFARKKDAKQWAAKCAVEWLQSRNRNKHELSPASPRKEKQAKVQKIEQPAASYDSYRTTSPGNDSPGGPSSGPSPAFVSPAPGHSVTISAGAGQQEQEKKSDTNTEPILATQKRAQSPAKSNPRPTPPLSPSRMAGDDMPAQSNPGPTPPLSPTRMTGDDTPAKEQSKTNSSSWWAQDPSPTKGNPSTPTKRNHPPLNKSVSSPAAIDTSELDSDTTPTRRVDMTCRKLGLSPPHYCIFKVGGESSSTNLFNGYASWPQEAAMPVRVGEVSEIYTKKGCKELVAEKVLGVLKEMELKRARMAAQLLGEATA